MCIAPLRADAIYCHGGFYQSDTSDFLAIYSAYFKEADTILPQSFLGKVGFLLATYWPSFARGAGATLLVALIGTFFGCLIGFLVGILQTIPTTPRDGMLKKVLLKGLNIFLTCYVELFRGTPMMVQAMVIYYGALQYLNISMSVWFAAFFIVSINTGAYMAETVRGGICSIDAGQTEGAKAIGMNHVQTMLYIILPQAFRNILPQIGNNLIINIKDSSVLSVISMTELFFVTKSVAGTYYTTFEAYIIACAMYLVMTLTCARILRYTERKLDGADSYKVVNTDTLAYTSGMANMHTARKKEGSKQ